MRHVWGHSCHPRHLVRVPSSQQGQVIAWTINSQINHCPGGEKAPLLGVTLDPLPLAEAFIPLLMREYMSSGLYWTKKPLSWPLWSLGEYNATLQQPPLVPTFILKNVVYYLCSIKRHSRQNKHNVILTTEALHPKKGMIHDLVIKPAVVGLIRTTESTDKVGLNWLNFDWGRCILDIQDTDSYCFNYI